jgi:hypothetical protein
METDTLFWEQHQDVGSPWFFAISNHGTADEDRTPAYHLNGYARKTTTITDYTGTANDRGIIEFNSVIHDGNGTISSAGNADILLSVRNNSSTKFAITGNGDVHGNVYRDAYDDEDDIKLAKAFSNPDSDVNYGRLVDLGIITPRGLLNFQKMHALEVGAIGQLFNVIRGLAKKLGVSEEELYDLAKQY